MSFLMDEQAVLTQMDPPQPSPLPWMAEKIVPAEALPGYGGMSGRMFRVVAKEGSINDWAAYCHYADEHSALDVAHHGDKLTPEDAAAIFPFLVIERYRL